MLNVACGVNMAARVSERLQPTILQGRKAVTVTVLFCTAELSALVMVIEIVMISES